FKAARPGRRRTLPCRRVNGYADTAAGYFPGSGVLGNNVCTSQRQGLTMKMTTLAVATLGAVLALGMAAPAAQAAGDRDDDRGRHGWHDRGRGHDRDHRRDDRREWRDDRRHYRNGYREGYRDARRSNQ